MQGSAIASSCTRLMYKADSEDLDVAFRDSWKTYRASFRQIPRASRGFCLEATVMAMEAHVHSSCLCALLHCIFTMTCIPVVVFNDIFTKQFVQLYRTHHTGIKPVGCYPINQQCVRLSVPLFVLLILSHFHRIGGGGVVGGHLVGDESRWSARTAKPGART